MRLTEDGLSWFFWALRHGVTGAFVCAVKNDILCPPAGFLACCGVGQVLPRAWSKSMAFFLLVPPTFRVVKVLELRLAMLVCCSNAS